MLLLRQPRCWRPLPCRRWPHLYSHLPGTEGGLGKNIVSHVNLRDKIHTLFSQIHFSNVGQTNLLVDLQIHKTGDNRKTAAIGWTLRHHYRGRVTFQMTCCGNDIFHFLHHRRNLTLSFNFFFLQDMYSVPRTILPHGASFNGHPVALHIVYESTKNTFTLEVFWGTFAIKSLSSAPF